MTTPEIAAAFANGMEYFNTFGGNPVSCEIGLAVLDVIARRAAAGARAPDVGGTLTRRPRSAWPSGTRSSATCAASACFSASSSCATGEPRARGRRQAAYVVERMKDHGILLSTDGPDHNVIKMKPPLSFVRRPTPTASSRPTTACSRKTS